MLLRIFLRKYRTKIFNKYKDATSLDNILYQAASDAVQGFKNDMIPKAAKIILVNLFPPIAPLIAIWQLVQEPGVYANKDVERSTSDKTVYNIGYTYKFDGKDDIGNTLFVEYSLNLVKTSQLLKKWGDQLLALVDNQYIKFVPKSIRDSFKDHDDALKKLRADVENFLESFSEKYLQRKIIILKTEEAYIKNVQSMILKEWNINGLELNMRNPTSAINKIGSNFLLTGSRPGKIVVNTFKNSFYPGHRLSK